MELGKEGRSYMKRRSRRNIVGAKPYMAPPWCRWPQAKEPLRSGWEVPPMKMSLSSRGRSGHYGFHRGGSRRRSSGC